MIYNIYTLEQQFSKCSAKFQCLVENAQVTVWGEGKMGDPTA